MRVRNSPEKLKEEPRNTYLWEYGEVANALKEPALQQLAKEATDETGYTPDVIDLFQQKYQLLFVCNGLKEDMPDHEYLEDPIYCGLAYTEMENFVMYCKNDKDPFPIPVLSPFDQYRASVEGEVFLVKTETVVKTDEFMSNTAYFNRKKVKIRLPWRIENDKGEVFNFNNKKLDAWMYIADGRTFKERISHNPTGFMICGQYFNEVSPRHYVFNSEDLEVSSQGA